MNRRSLLKSFLALLASVPLLRLRGEARATGPTKPCHLHPAHPTPPHDGDLWYEPMIVRADTNGFWRDHEWYMAQGRVCRDLQPLGFQVREWLKPTNWISLAHVGRPEELIAYARCIVEPQKARADTYGQDDVYEVPGFACCGAPVMLAHRDNCPKYPVDTPPRDGGWM